MRKKFKYSFARKDETEGGFTSVLYAGISFGLFLIAALLSFAWSGNAGSWIGAFGVMAMLFSFFGFLAGIKSFKERDKNYRYSVIGAMANGVFLVGWLALFLIGIK